MTEQELRKLNRLELLELLLEEVRENERLRAQLKRANQELANRKIETERAGSIAQAALQLNGVFDAAQRAAEQYVENVRRLADTRYGIGSMPHNASVPQRPDANPQRTVAAQRGTTSQYARAQQYDGAQQQSAIARQAGTPEPAAIPRPTGRPSTQANPGEADPYELAALQLVRNESGAK